MKILIVIVLFVSVALYGVHTIKCYNCYQCNGENLEPLDCPKDNGCISITMPPGSTLPNEKRCILVKDAEQYCTVARAKGGKCYYCVNNFCNEGEYRQYN